MVCPVVIRAHQHQVGQLGGPTVLPMSDVVGVQTPGGPTTGNHTRAVAMLKRTTQPTIDLTSRSTAANDLPVTFKLGLKGGITEQISAFGLAEQRTQVQASGTLLHV